MKWDYASLQDNFAQYISLSKADGLDDVDFVIWGETASPFALDMEPAYRMIATQAIPENGYLITGSIRFDIRSETDYSPLNSMLIINKKGEIIDSYDRLI